MIMIRVDMAFLGVLFIAVFFLALLLMIALAIISLIVIGSGAVALAAGGLAGASTIKDNLTKKLTLLVCLAVFLFAVSCFALVGILVWSDAYITLLIVGYVSEAATITLGIIGLVNVRNITKKVAKVLFIVLFSLAVGLGVLALGIFALATYLPLPFLP